MPSGGARPGAGRKPGITAEVLALRAAGRHDEANDLQSQLAAEAEAQKRGEKIAVDIFTREPREPARSSLVTATPYQWRDPSTTPQRQWLHGRHLIRQFLAVTVAAGGVGKTTEIITEALELVTGFSLVTGHR